MVGERNSYDRAVDQFLQLAEAPLAATYQTPRALALACNMAPSTGYRSIRAMEAAGWLRRNSLGAYECGARRPEVGLSAWGMGRFASGAFSVVDQLRRESGRTAFLGILSQGQLFPGIVSSGRGSGYVMPGASALPVGASNLVRAECAHLELQDGGTCIDAVAIRLSAHDPSDVHAALGLFIFGAAEIEEMTELLGRSRDLLMPASRVGF